MLMSIHVPAVFAQKTLADNSISAETETDTDLDRDFKPASSKNGIENQIIELKDIIKQKRKEVDDWGDLVSGLKNVAENKQTVKVNINQSWAEIEKSLNNPRADYNSLNQKFQAIIQYFFPVYGMGYSFNDDKRMPSINRFLSALNNKIGEIRTRYNIQTQSPIYKPYDYKYTKEDIEASLDYRNIYNDSVYILFYKDYLKTISESLESAKKRQSSASEYIKQVYKRIEDLNKASEDKDISINQRAINIGLPLFCGTVIVLFLIAYLYRKLNTGSTQKNEDSDGFMSKILLEIITVLLITMTVLILGLARILAENVLGTLLGAIAGYILNRSNQSNLKKADG